MYFLDDISVNSSSEIYIPRGYRRPFFSPAQHTNKRRNTDKIGFFAR